MSMITAVTKVMTQRLSKLGYPTDDIRWSLSYCQGDGASFTGKLDLKLLGARVLPDIDPAVWVDANLDLELTRSGNYVHERSTSLNYDFESITGFDPEELGGVAQTYALGRLLAVIEEEIVTVGNEMAADGYKVIESYIREDELKRTFHTKNFEVKVWAVSDEHSDCFDYYDDTCSEDMISKLLAENIYFGGVKIEIIQTDDDGDEIATLATLDMGGCEWLRSGSIFKCGVVRDLLREAVCDARDTFARLKRPTLKAA